MALNNLDVIYDDKVFGSIIDPTQWNANFKLIETVVNGNNDTIDLHFINFVNPHQVTKIQVGLQNVDDIKQATKAEFNAFVARTDNPHSVTANQVGAYSKTEVQTSGNAAIHWDNLTNVPNMADSSWKSAVANPASLPTTGNNISDQRVVLNDGDGKQALYICVATTGNWDTQWDKIADVDFAGDEATRVTQENARVVAENSRVSAEAIRTPAEAIRVSNESSRINAENIRVPSENTRVINEINRVSNETTRNTEEGLRSISEGNRVSAEIVRKNQETSRVNAEITRESIIDSMKYIDVFSSGTPYAINNQVTYGGSTYRCISPSMGNLPTNETYWILISAKGVDGLGAGDMLKSTYDTTENGIVDNAEKVNGLTVLTAVPTGAKFTDTVYIHPTTAGNKHIPTGGTVGQILKNTASGTATWQSESVTPIANNITETVAGKALDATQGKVLNDLISTKAKKATNEATASDGQVMTSNGDGTFTYEAPTGGAPLDSPNFTGTPTVSTNMIYHTGNITLTTTPPVSILADGVQVQVY